MRVLSSLTNRVFLSSAVLVVAAMGVAMYRVNTSVTTQAEADLAAGLAEAASLVEQVSRTEFEDFLVKGQLIADLPVLRGATATEDPPTVQPIAEDYQARIGADLFVVLGRDDRVLARAGRIRPPAAEITRMLATCRSTQAGTCFWPRAEGLLHVAVIPLDAGLAQLALGMSLDAEAAHAIRTATQSDIAFVTGDRVVASSFDGEAAGALATVAEERDTFMVRIADEEFVGRVQPLDPRAGADGPVALVLRSRTEHLRFLPVLRWQIALTGLAAVMAATVSGYLVARTVTRPLRALTGAMRDMAATGDLARPLPALGRWDDEDVRLVAGTFDQLTGALGRFQREASLRERLSSLGRLSTVVAHEIRNPLMIIKSAVRRLRRVPAPEAADVAQSIDEEVSRLNGVVSGVLDFARPIQFELSETDVGAVCRTAVDAARSAADDVPIESRIPATPLLSVTDAERLRAVLINVLSNAQQAVRSGPVRSSVGAPVSIEAERGAGRVLIRVRDTGGGIGPEDLRRVFEPFFTTKPGGSGLGLAIARNIIEGLGGAIRIESQQEAGTTVYIELADRSDRSR